MDVDYADPRRQNSFRHNFELFVVPIRHNWLSRSCCNEGTKLTSLHYNGDAADGSRASRAYFTASYVVNCTAAAGNILMALTPAPL